MTFTQLHNLIPKAASHWGITKELKAAEICHHARKILPEIIKNPNITKGLSPAHYKDGTLTIKTLSPAHSQEVIMRKDKLIKALNEKLGKKVITNLQAQLHNTDMFS